MKPFDERVKDIFRSLHTTANKFASDHGFNRVSIYNTINPDRRPGLDLLERICVAEPRISAEYLLRGEGEPLRNLNAPTALTTVQQLREFQIQMNEFIEKRVKELEG